MTRFLGITLTLAVVMVAACGWSAEQKEVKDAYNALIDAFDAGDYGTAFDMMSSNTQVFLDELATGLAAWGYPMGDNGRELLEEMFAGQDMTGLTRSISSITVEGDHATLVAVADEGDDILGYVREDGEWKIDLKDMISQGFSEGLEGSGFTIEDILEAPYMDDDYYMETGDGDCPIDIYNGLGDWTIWYIYVDLATDPWGDDRLGSELLYPGEMFTVWVDPGTYDIQVEDEDGDTYTLWGVEIDETGYYWEVTLADMD
jgi:hypothetical protein